MELFESLLRRKRINLTKKHLRLSPESSLIDIGCGKDTGLLHNLKIKERVGIDIEIEPRYRNDLKLIKTDICKEPLPFSDNRFDAATMLAVIEHIPPKSRPQVIAEAVRVLKPGGRILITTPSPVSKSLLTALARTGLISRSQIQNHKDLLDPQEIENLLRINRINEIRSGHFEMGLNYWITGVKQSQQ